MKKQYIHRPAALRFRRWSRKGYAAFISVQRAVTIGQLSACVSERFQSKNGSIHASVITPDKVVETEADEASDASLPDSPGDRLSLLLQQIVRTVRIAGQTAAAHAYITNNYFKIAESLGHVPRTFRDSFLYKL